MHKMTTAPIDAGIADKLLDLLSTDDDFRDRFQHDPLEALHALGYESPPPSRMTACGSMPLPRLEPFAECKVRQLASKQAIAESRAEIKAMLIRGLAHTTPQLDASTGQSRPVRK